MNPNYINNQENINLNNLHNNSRNSHNLSKETEDIKKQYEQDYDQNLNENNNLIENENEENNQNNSSTDSQGKKPIYVMSLQLDDGKIAKLKIYSDSDPNELSQAFCLNNNLDPQAAEYLASQIQKLIEQFNNE